MNEELRAKQAPYNTPINNADDLVWWVSNALQFSKLVEHSIIWKNLNSHHRQRARDLLK